MRWAGPCWPRRSPPPRSAEPIRSADLVRRVRGSKNAMGAARHASGMPKASTSARAPAQLAAQLTRPACVRARLAARRSHPEVEGQRLLDARQRGSRAGSRARGAPAVGLGSIAARNAAATTRSTCAMAAAIMCSWTSSRRRGRRGRAQTLRIRAAGCAQHLLAVGQRRRGTPIAQVLATGFGGVATGFFRAPPERGARYHAQHRRHPSVLEPCRSRTEALATSCKSTVLSPSKVVNTSLSALRSGRRLTRR